MLKKSKGLLLVLVVLFVFPSVSPGQAVFLARKALGLISRIADQVQGHETASVLLEADAGKVYRAAVKIIGEKPDIQIVSKDETGRSISFRRDNQAITLKVARLQDDLTQILVVSSGGDGRQDPTFVVNGICQICKEVGVHCWPSDE
ncbi:MAG: hypothetical protein JRL30_11340 [Deltaproteobacteria bacterium]|nr:hypothetical protein [Deltaproteobacteria bacterium]